MSDEAPHLLVDQDGAILIATLRFRDKRRSRQLHDELVRRRQARRSKAVQA